MSDALDVRITDVRIGVENVRARQPFRFGNATIWKVAQATVAVSIETRDGKRAKGYAADFLSYAWFDKRPGRTPEQGSCDLLTTIEAAGQAWCNAGFAPAFAHWRDLHSGLEDAAVARGQNRLSGNFGVSMIERGVIDAIGRLTGHNFHDMIRGSVFGINEPSVFPELPTGSVATSLPPAPVSQMALRHTVGLADPLSAADSSTSDGDDASETLEELLATQNLAYLKIKISGDADESLERLAAIAALMMQSGRKIAVTLDGNEQFADMSTFADLAERIKTHPDLQAFWDAILFIEQPVERQAALDSALNPSTMTSIGKSLIIDESDGWTTAFREAMDLGYHGVSHKNCKGVFRSFLNNALAAQRNATNPARPYFLSAEDLSCLPMVSLHGDLVAAASLGIHHTERNGHHYFGGLDHLSPREQTSAVDYGALYHRVGDAWSLNVASGKIDVTGLSVPGLGITQPPDMDRLQRPEDWEFDATN